MKKNYEKELEKYINYLKKQPKGFIYNTERKDADKNIIKKKKKTKKSVLKILYKKFINCQQCPLSTMGRTQVVFGNGNPKAKLMFIGEGPGRDEDLQGTPFVGRAGQLLTKIINAMGINREDTYITNVVKCRPPNNRTPLPNESNTCKKLILLKEISIIKPKIICTLGSSATKALLSADISISSSRGKLFTFKDIPVLPTFHPAYLLRNPAAKKIVWEDMKKILEILAKK